MASTQNSFNLALNLSKNLKPGDELIVTEIDHRCNSAPWRSLERIGCVGGNVLEPSMGVGAFFGHRHSKFDTHNAKLYGVELDSVSGRIAKQL